MPVAADTQFAEASAKSLRIRKARAALKREIRAGQRTVIDILGPSTELPEEARTMEIARLLALQAQWGPSRIRWFLRGLMIGENRSLCDLTERQRAVLVENLSDPRAGAKWARAASRRAA